MYIVTGAAGFIGSHLVRGLNRQGIAEVIAVDDLTDGEKFGNLADCEIADYLDRDTFRDQVRRGALAVRPTALFHQGACADTTGADGRFMMETNYAYSKDLFHWAVEQRIPFVYASSGSVYGRTTDRCIESPEHENPLNVYAYSKLLFDRYVRRHLNTIETTVAGLRYFNVYGPREGHKGRMASMVSQLLNQLCQNGQARLFQGTGGYGDGQQRRDFVFVEDVVAVNLFFGFGPPRRGVFNVGTGQGRSFNEVAQTLIDRLGQGQITYIPFPESLRGKYQNHTEADISALRRAGFDKDFHSLEAGIDRLLAEEERTADLSKPHQDDAPIRSGSAA